MFARASLVRDWSCERKELVQVCFAARESQMCYYNILGMYRLECRSRHSVPCPYQAITLLHRVFAVGEDSNVSRSGRSSFRDAHPELSLYRRR